MRTDTLRRETAPTTYTVRAVRVDGRVYIDRDDVSAMIEGDSVHALLDGEVAAAERCTNIATRIAGFTAPERR